MKSYSSISLQHQYTSNPPPLPSVIHSPPPLMPWVSIRRVVRAQRAGRAASVRSNSLAALTRPELLVSPYISVWPSPAPPHLVWSLLHLSARLLGGGSYRGALSLSPTPATGNAVITRLSDSPIPPSSCSVKAGFPFPIFRSFYAKSTRAQHRKCARKLGNRSARQQWAASDAVRHAIQGDTPRATHVRRRVPLSSGINNGGQRHLGRGGVSGRGGV